MKLINFFFRCLLLIRNMNMRYCLFRFRYFISIYQNNLIFLQIPNFTQKYENKLIFSYFVILNRNMKLFCFFFSFQHFNTKNENVLLFLDIHFLFINMKFTFSSHWPFLLSKCETALLFLQILAFIEKYEILCKLSI